MQDFSHQSKQSNPEPRQHQSKQLIDNGYLDWLCAEMANAAAKQFAATPPENVEELKSARLRLDFIAELRQFVTSSVNHR